ncbi:MAG: PKD domain-containing protein [Vicingaceae bacterium]|nr:PKD domain-containing protein [Vicingaceae bacterium]
MKRLFNVAFCFLISIVALAHGKQQSDYHFTENKGQLNQTVKYHTKLHIGDIYFEANKFTFDMYSADDIARLDEIRHHDKDKEKLSKVPFKIRKHSYSMSFSNSNTQSTIVTTHKLAYHKNYFKGNDQSKWAIGVNSYEGISYKNLYNNIDVDVYSINDNLKYDFIVGVGGDVTDIKVDYENVETLKLENGVLVISLSTGVVKEMKPFAYQMVDNKKVNVPCEFDLNGTEITYNFPKGYNKNKELVIDPTWIFSTLTGSSADNWGFTATYDNNENFYGGSIAFGAGYPTSVGAYDITFGGNVDAVITKFNPSGTAIMYSTYIGGSDADQPHSLVTDADSNLVILGVTSSNNFPTTTGAYGQTFNGGSIITEDGITYGNGTDIFITKLDGTGAALIGSTYLGGSANDGFSLNNSLKYNYADHARGEVILDAAEDIYIASSTLSNNFPTTLGVYGPTQFGGEDGVSAKFNSNLTTLIWSTYIGGSAGDAAYSIRVDDTNNAAFICGGTQSTNLATTTGVVGPTNSGGVDGFVLRLDESNGALSALTYLGTNSYDQTYILELDDDLDVYVVGQTNGNYPVTSGSYSNVGANQFIHKLNNNLTVTDFSTVFGSVNSSNINISLTAFLVDNCDNIYVGGWGGSVNSAGGNTFNMPITPNAIQSTTDGSDFYFIVLDRDAQNLLYGTYFGSSSAAEHVDGGTSRFDKKGTIYEGVCAACGNSNFPTSPSAYSSTNGSSNCNFGAIKIGLDFQGVTANATAPPNLTLCGAPYTVNFTTSSNPVPPNHYWDFGDSMGTDTAANPAYTYQDTGTYVVMYVAIDSSTCNIADTVYFNVEVIQNDSLIAQFSFPPYDPCDDSMLVQLDFTGSGADSLFWNMGDGSIFTNDTSITYYYTIPGTYIITFEAYDTLCGNSYTIIDTVEYNPVFTAVNATVPPNILLCDSPYVVNFSGNTPTPPNSYWDFGDGLGTSVLSNPSYTYQDSGTYVVMYVAIDSSTCNIADTAYFNVQLTKAPPFSATLDFDPPPLCGSDSFLVELNFTGTGADSLVWDLGDGTQIINVDSTIYIYTLPGTYNITMTAYNFLCNKTQTISNEVIFTEVKTTEGIIPNVFSPNGDGMNDKLEFVGVDGTKDFSVKIYNRWGVSVYEGTDATAHWDGGSHNSGVYFYELKYTDVCNDEEKLVTGYVTLMK